MSNTELDKDWDYTQSSFKHKALSKWNSLSKEAKVEDKPFVNKTFEAKFYTMSNWENSQKYCSRLSDIRDLYK